MSDQPKTLFEKVWDNHVVVQEANSPAVLYIDLQLVHEVTSPQAFQGLRDKGLKVRKLSQTVATMDHSIPTTDPSIPIQDKVALAQLEMLEFLVTQMDMLQVAARLWEREKVVSD